MFPSDQCFLKKYEKFNQIVPIDFFNDARHYGIISNVSQYFHCCYCEREQCSVCELYANQECARKSQLHPRYSSRDGILNLMKHGRMLDKVELRKDQHCQIKTFGFTLLFNYSVGLCNFRQTCALRVVIDRKNTFTCFLLIINSKQ
jgi:hypothetical protein